MQGGGICCRAAEREGVESVLVAAVAEGAAGEEGASDWPAGGCFESPGVAREYDKCLKGLGTAAAQMLILMKMGEEDNAAA